MLSFISRDVLTSFRKNHFGLQFGLEKLASKTTFLSFPSLAYWSTNGFKKLSGFYETIVDRSVRDKARHIINIRKSQKIRRFFRASKNMKSDEKNINNAVLVIYLFFFFSKAAEK